MTTSDSTGTYRSVLTKNCAGIIGFNRYIYELNCSINSERQFFSCATIAVGEPYVASSISQH